MSSTCEAMDLPFLLPDLAGSMLPTELPEVRGTQQEKRCGEQELQQEPHLLPAALEACSLPLRLPSLTFSDTDQGSHDSTCHRFQRLPSGLEG